MKKDKVVKAWGLKSPTGELLARAWNVKHKADYMRNCMFKSFKVVRVEIREIK